MNSTPPSGFRDFLPGQAALRQRAAETIARVYRSFGYQPIATSALEDLAALTSQGGGENEKLIFKVMRRGEALERARAENGELADLGLRFDLTLPLARYYARHGSQLPHPFKAYHLGPVWRAERAQKGRYREFWQCDADIVGADSWGAEVEIILAILAVFSEFGLSGIEVHLNDRRLVERALETAQVPPEKRDAACVILDKLDKLERSQILTELSAELGAGPAAAVEKTLMSEEAGAAYEALGPAEVSALRRIESAVQAVAPDARLRLSPHLMRGLGYYTGPVFEFRHPSLSGSLGGGGRYDRLTAVFGGPPVPACGASIGFERLLLLLEEKNDAEDPGSPDVVVTVFDDSLRPRSIEIGAALRAQGLVADVFPGMAKLKAQFKYADQKKASWAVAIGPDEAARGVLQLKNLRTGEERAVSLDEARALIAA
ncbi:MAG: histidine--tRNA ligase [Elusimicrobia bacterium]|nr:histidine--tRNA ligase [Elusimicrobiota bacterium]